ncbi:MAG: CidA/LrgA family protein [Tissierellia bacterium]|nr:CidA/LrgA family protein [Tissierellia bacterium]
MKKHRSTPPAVAKRTSDPLMEWMKGFTLLLICLFLGNILNALIPLAIPGAIYGILVMLTALSLKIIDIEDIDPAAQTLLGAMALFFIPGAVNLMTVVPEIKDELLKLFVLVILSTSMVFFVTGYTVELILKLQGKLKGV